MSQTDREQSTLEAFPSDSQAIGNALELALEQFLEHHQLHCADETSKRWVKAISEFFVVKPDVELRLFREPEASIDGNLVRISGIKFNSICEHHLFPFFGTVDVSYLINSSTIVGLSKIPRLVKRVAKQPQVQERLTRQIGERCLEISQDVGVVVDGVHTCMTCRGIEGEGSTQTAFFAGVMSESPWQNILLFKGE